MTIAGSSVMLFMDVGWENDGMRPMHYSLSPLYWSRSDIVSNGGDYSSDGDIATVTVGSLDSYIEAHMHSPLNRDTFDTMIVRARTTDPSKTWKMQVITTDNTTHESTSYDNTTWENKVWFMPVGTYSYSTIRLYFDAYGTFYVDYAVIAGRSPYTLNPLSLTVERNLSDEPSTAEIEILYPPESTFGIGNHVKIWLREDSTWHKVFTGKIQNIDRNIRGKDTRTIIYKCVDYSRYLKDRLLVKNTVYSGTLDTVVKELVKDLVDEGYLTIYNVATSDIPVSSLRVEEYETPSDKLARLASDYDYEYYVDFGKDLHFFKRGTRASSLNINTMTVIEYPLREIGDGIINKVTIIGSSGDTIGSDVAWTEGITNWHSNLDSNIESDDNVVRTGIRSIKASIATDSPIWLARDVGTIDLSLAGKLCFAMQYKAVVNESDKIEGVTIRTSFIGSGGTFYYDTGYSGGLKSRKSLGRYDAPNVADYPPQSVPPYVYYYFPLADIEVPINRKGVVEPVRIGNPRWDQINTIKIEILSPVGVGTEYKTLWIDNMRIEDVLFSSTYEDATSITRYGKKEWYKMVGNIPNESGCALLASLTVQMYKDPIKLVEDVYTVHNFDFNIGYEYTLDVEGETVPVILRNITHEVDGLELHTRLNFSKMPIPQPKNLISRLIRDLTLYKWDILAWKDKCLPSGHVVTRQDLITYWESDPLLTSEQLTSRYMFFEQWNTKDTLTWEFLEGTLGAYSTITPDTDGIPCLKLHVDSESDYVRVRSKYLEFSGGSIRVVWRARLSGSFDETAIWLNLRYDDNNRIGFRFIDSSVSAFTQDTSVVSRLDGTSSIIQFTVDPFTYHKYRLDIHGSGSILVYVDDACKGTITSNIPSSSLKLDLYIYDYASIENNLNVRNILVEELT